MVLKWEEIDRHTEGRAHMSMVSRTKIPGGWLVKGVTQSGAGGGIGLTFVPDPDYKWELGGTPPG